MHHVLCAHCGLFIRENETRCPFCQAEHTPSAAIEDPEVLPRLPRNAFYALTIAASTVMDPSLAMAQAPPLGTSAYGVPSLMDRGIPPGMMQGPPQVAPMYGTPAPIVAPPYGIPNPGPGPSHPTSVRLENPPTRIPTAPVETALRARTAAFHQCSTRADAEHSVSVEVRVARNGRTNLRVVSGGGPSTGTCVMNIARPLRFGRIPDTFTFTVFFGRRTRPRPPEGL